MVVVEEEGWYAIYLSCYLVCGAVYHLSYHSAIVDAESFVCGIELCASLLTHYFYQIM